MKRCFCLFAAVWAVLAAEAQSLLCDDGTFHWESGISAALNNDGYELALRGYYFPIPYIGMKVELGFAGEIEEISDWDISWGDGWNDWGDESDYAIRFKFNPAIALRTPRLIHWKGQDAGFYLFTEPGIVLSPGASGSRKRTVVSLGREIGHQHADRQVHIHAGLRHLRFQPLLREARQPSRLPGV